MDYKNTLRRKSIILFPDQILLWKKSSPYGSVRSGSWFFHRGIPSFRLTWLKTIFSIIRGILNTCTIESIAFFQQLQHKQGWNHINNIHSSHQVSYRAFFSKKFYQMKIQTGFHETWEDLFEEIWILHSVKYQWERKEFFIWLEQICVRFGIILW